MRILHHLGAWAVWLVAIQACSMIIWGFGDLTKPESWLGALLATTITYVANLLLKRVFT